MKVCCLWGRGWEYEHIVSAHIFPLNILMDAGNADKWASVEKIIVFKLW